MILPDPQSADVVIIGQSRDLQLQRFRRCRSGYGWAVLDDSIEQRRQMSSPCIPFALFLIFASPSSIGRCRLTSCGIIYHDALSCDAVKDREIQLLVVGFQIHKELVHLIDDFVDPGILLVDLVDETGSD